MVPSSPSVRTGADESTLVVGDEPSELDAPVAAGTALGRYVVIEVVGRGGMGEVIRAYDPKLRREVALKRVRSDRIGELASSRLLREAQAMARLRHPNVVAVYDVEIDEGALLLAMEYVDGCTLQAWLQQQDRSWSEVLRVFRAAGTGLAAAHHAGIVHRDVKPTNVLVAADGRTQVTDFGIAKADDAVVEARSSGELPRYDPNDSLDSLSSPLTEADRVVGTPRYMAPEQATGATTAASDQYAFCVALWEALCGERPFDGSWKQMLAAKRAGPPSWPKGTKVPRRIAAAIVRGLAPRPEARWPSMDALLASLREDAHLHRRWWVGAAVATALATTAVIVIATRDDSACSGAEERLAGVWDATREAEISSRVLATGAPFAGDVWARVDPALDAYAQEWMAMHRQACEAATIRGEQSPAVMDLRMACLERARTQLAASTDLLMEADAAVVARAHTLVGGLPAIARCEDVEGLQSEVPPPEDAELARRVEEVREQIAAARARLQAGQYAAARELLVAAAADEATTSYAPLATEVDAALGKALLELAALDESEAALLRALRSAIALGQWSEAREAANELVYLVGYRAARPTEAHAYAEIAKGLQARPGADWRSEVRLHGNRGSWLQAAGRYAEAESEFRAALALHERWRGAHHPGSATARSNLATALNRSGKEAESEAEHRIVLATRIEALGEKHPDVATSRNNLGNALDTQRKHAEAEAEYRAALELRIEVLGADHPDTAGSRSNLANTLSALGRKTDAVTEYRAAIRSLIATLGPEHPEVAMSRSNLASVLDDLGREREAEAENRSALQTMTKAFGPVHPNVAQVRNNLADLLRRIGRAEEAEAEYREAIEVYEATTGPDSLDLAIQLLRFGSFLNDLGRHGEAREALERARDIAARDDGADAVREEIANALASVGRTPRSVR